jgi:hypothetical protein
LLSCSALSDNLAFFSTDEWDSSCKCFGAFGWEELASGLFLKAREGHPSA